MRAANELKTLDVKSPGSSRLRVAMSWEIQKQSKKLETKELQDGLILTQYPMVALEKAKAEKES